MVSSLCYLRVAALYGTVSGCRWATLVIPHAHFSFISRLSCLCFFRCNPQKPFFFWFTYYSSLDRLEILSRHSGVGTCIRCQVNAPVLICRYRTYRTACTNKLLVLCITFVNQETASFIRLYVRPWLDQLEPTNHPMGLRHTVYTRCVSC